MFHEVAHGLGIKNVVNGKGTVRDALKEKGSALVEGKADILGLYMINQLHAKGEIQGDMKDYYTTFLAGIFRSVRFGAASAHGPRGSPAHRRTAPPSSAPAPRYTAHRGS